jgi:hypothetical protein
MGAATTCVVRYGSGKCVRPNASAALFVQFTETADNFPYYRRALCQSMAGFALVVHHPTLA